MVEGLRAPEKNRHGLVIPPTPAKVTPSRESYYKNKVFSDRHHLYFPRVVFQQTSSLAFEFREHRFNSIWLPRFQHDRLHRRYGLLIEAFPDYLMPEDDVMATFLDEARLLDKLDVCVKAIDMIDEALYEGQVSHRTRAEAHRASKLMYIEENLPVVSRFEVVSPFIARSALSNIARVIPAAA